MCLSHSHHHHVMLLARISLTLSRHFSLSFIASGWSSGLHPVSSHSCCMYVRAGRPGFAGPYAGSIGVHHWWVRPCFSSSVLRVWFVLLGYFSWWQVSGCIVGAFWGVTARTCSILLAAFLSLLKICDSSGNGSVFSLFFFLSNTVYAKWIISKLKCTDVKYQWSLFS